MLRESFVTAAIEACQHTPNIRTYSKSWEFSGVNRIPDEISSRMDAIVKLLQALVDDNKLCSKNEYLMIYNFQPSMINAEGTAYYSIDMVVKPLSLIAETEVVKGKSLGIIINGTTGEVMNNTQGMIDNEIIQLADVEAEGLEAPVVYGNYKTAENLYNRIQTTFLSFVDMDNQLTSTCQSETEDQVLSSFLSFRQKSVSNLLQCSGFSDFGFENEISLKSSLLAAVPA